MQCQLHRSAHPAKPGIQLLGLRNRSGKTVENKPTLTFRTAQLVRNGIDDQVVRDQIPAFHDRFDFPAQFGFLGHRTTQDLAARDLWYTILLSHQSGLGPFPGTGCSQQNYSHHSTPIFSDLVDLKAYPPPQCWTLELPHPGKIGASTIVSFSPLSMCPALYTHLVQAPPC